MLSQATGLRSLVHLAVHCLKMPATWPRFPSQRSSCALQLDSANTARRKKIAPVDSCVLTTISPDSPVIIVARGAFACSLLALNRCSSPTFNLYASYLACCPVPCRSQVVPHCRGVVSSMLALGIASRPFFACTLAVTFFGPTMCDIHQLSCYPRCD